MADARKDKRTLLSLKIRYKSATLEDFIERYSGDISRGGVFIKAKKPLAVGTLLKFEFMLQDESTLIHGVGRVVWRRDEADASAENPAGMGIKFIKMDASSRAVVKKIADDRLHTGVFEEGKDGARSFQVADSEPQEEEDQTKVRHVSEFLSSALEEGGAGETAQREAKAGAERARRQSDNKQAATAYGAFSAPRDVPSQQKPSVSEAQSRGAMSAFGGSGLSTAARVAGSVAPALDELDAEDDFLESETTKVHDYPVESYRPEAAATVVAKDAFAPLYAERRATPVVPAMMNESEPLRGEIPDLFDPGKADSFGPGPGEVIDPKFFDSDEERAGPPVPEAPGIPSEAFKVPQAAEPVWTTRPTPEKKARPGLVILLVAVVALAGVGVVAWQLGFLNGVIAAIAPNGSPRAKSARVAKPVAAPVVESEEAGAEAPSPERAGVRAAADEAEGDVDAEAVAEAAPAQAAPADVANTGMMKFEVVSVPPGAFVSVNGQRAGRTPLQLEYEVGTKLSIYAKIRGYLGRRQRIQVVAGQEPVDVKLVPLPYVVQVVTSPEGAMASAVGGGVVTTPGELQFKSMPRSRRIVISMNGYETANTSVFRTSFTEETRRMFTTVNLTLQKEGAAPSPEVSEPTPSEAQAAPPAEPAPSEAKTEPPAEPKAAEEAPAPSETDAADAP